MQSISTTGKHILAEFWQCQCDPVLLTSLQPLLSLLTQAVEEVGLTLVGEVGHEFGQQSLTNKDLGSNSVHSGNFPDKIEPNPLDSDHNSQQISGITLTLLLAESHICLHTWGEYKTVTMDVYVCNVSADNSHKAQALFDRCLEIFKPNKHHVNSVSRQHQIPNI